MLPNPDILNNYPYGKFVLSNLAAKRAKQLTEGAPALIHINSSHPLTIALAEIAAGKIKPIMSDNINAIDDSDAEVLVTDTTGEVGMLLPALEDAEIALVESELVEEHSDEILEEDGVRSIADLVGEDEETEVGADADEDTLSLSSMAEQETLEEEGSEESI